MEKLKVKCFKVKTLLGNAQDKLDKAIDLIEFNDYKDLSNYQKEFLFNYLKDDVINLVKLLGVLDNGTSRVVLGVKGNTYFITSDNNKYFDDEVEDLKDFLIEDHSIKVKEGQLFN